MPLIEIVISQKNAYIKAHTPKSDFQFDPDEYSKALDVALALIRSEYDGPIVFVYHPLIIVNKDGSIPLDYCETWNLFCSACLNNIDDIDSGQDFLRIYESNHELPNGFANSTLGKGHLNKLGHRIIANEIIDYLEGLN